MTQESRRPALLLGLCAAAVALPPLAAGQTYTYNGPFTGTGAAANPWSTDSWIGGTPVSGATTQLFFRNSDATSYSANNDLGNPFLLNSAVLQSFAPGSTTVSSLTGNSLQLTGANPTVTMSGPGNVTFGTGGNGLALNPASGTTTFNGNGAGIVTTGNNTITGSGGLVLNNTGAGGVSLFGNNTFTGGVTLNSGTLAVSAANALGAAANVLTVNGGTLRTVISATVANAVTLNNDLVFTGGTLTLNGAISGAGGLQLFNGTNFSSQSLTLGGALTFAGPVTIQNSLARPSFLTGGTFSTLTLPAAASLGSTQPITVGNNGTLALTGNAANTRVPNANALVLSGGQISLTSTAGANTASRETFGNVSASGLNVISVTANAASNALAFGTLTRQDNATLLLRGPWNGTNNVLTFAGGLANVSDPLAPNNAGQYTGIVPFAAGNNIATNVNAATRVNYDPVAGATFISPLDSTRVFQLGNSGTFDANTSFKNVNIAGGEITINGAQRVNSLSATTGGTTTTGSGTLTVSSGSVIVASGSFGPAFDGPTLDFGAATGYLHLGGNITVQGASTVTGSGGLVVSGLDGPGSGSGSGGGSGYALQFSNAANPFTGGLFINGNAGVNFTSDAQLGATGGQVTLNGGGLNFNPAPTAGVLIKRPITLGAAGGSITGLTGNSIELSGTISGAGGLTIGSAAFANGGATVTLSGTNTYAGPTYVEGTSATVLRVFSDANLGSTAAPLNLQGGAATVQFLAANTFAKPIVITAGGANLDTANNAVTLAAPISGIAPAGFNKIGAGTLTLAVSSPLFAGRVNVNAGTLSLAAADTLPQVTILTINSGGTLAGNGAVGGSVVVAAGGTLAPGNSAGRISVGNSLTFAANSVAFMEIGGATSADYDQLVVGGALTFNGTLTLSLLNNFVPTLNEKFYLFDDIGLLSPTGTFANGTGVGNLLFTDNAGNTYQINYADHDPADLSNALNNDVSLTVVGVVPEPSTWALLLASVAGTGLFARARRSSARGIARRDG